MNGVIDLPIEFEYEDARALGEMGELAHWHGAIEVVGVTRGRMRCQTNAHAFELEKGDLCFIARRQLHRLMRDGETEGAARTLVVGTDVLVQNPAILDAYVRPVLENPAFEHMLLPGHREATARLRHEIDELEMLLAERPPAFELEAIARCHQIFRGLFLALSERGTGETEIDANLEVVRTMISFIREHSSENVQLEDIAAAARVSKSTCARLFKRYTGRSPVTYLIAYRLETAAAMLRQGSDPIGAIAHACGFSQQSYFTRMFLREFGVTPRAWRAGKSEVG